MLIGWKIQDSTLARTQSDWIAQVLYLKTLRTSGHIDDSQGIPCAAGKFQLLGKPTDGVPFLSGFHRAAGGLYRQERQSQKAQTKYGDAHKTLTE